MNSLEFIEKEIAYWTDEANEYKKMIYEDETTLNYCQLAIDKQRLKNAETRLNHLHQIKAELEAWKEKEKGIRVFKESKQDALCPICHHYINFDCLNDELKYAPKYCCECGTKIIFTEEDVLKH